MFSSIQEQNSWQSPRPATGGVRTRWSDVATNPGQRKVFFTVDSKVVHEVHCKTEDYCAPLYPTLTSNGDTVVLVNLGQSPFSFEPANLQRSLNPCFMGASPALGSNNNTVSSIKSLQEYDQESEGDLFEIVLESSGRSPYTSTNTH
ncbi:hypothetical protein SASPL_103053 [Salvia splendens]|uniref:Uncharacterized protein n=1 Tax=Salvia splendens TaxID=180675 RepID=A0A8X9ADC2_SALSN|nr:hypothetical protein SASPL_103053 [Salvia splendens]